MWFVTAQLCGFATISKMADAGAESSVLSALFGPWGLSDSGWLSLHEVCPVRGVLEDIEGRLQASTTNPPINTVRAMLHKDNVYRGPDAKVAQTVIVLQGYFKQGVTSYSVVMDTSRLQSRKCMPRSGEVMFMGWCLPAKYTGTPMMYLSAGAMPALEAAGVVGCIRIRSAPDRDVYTYALKRIE